MRSTMEELQIKLGFDTYPKEYTCDGKDLSPQVKVSGLEQPYMAIILDDPDCPSGTFVHWVIWNIPAMETIPQGISDNARPPELPGAVQGVNSAGSLGYMGPCPPAGRPHRYYLKVYGMESKIDLEPGATKRMLEKALENKARQYGEAMATYQRR